MLHAFAWRPAMLAALTPALAFAAAPAFAQDAAPRSIAVSYHDLDLTTAHGRHQLDWRLRHSAQDVCGYDRTEHMGLQNYDARACYETALAHAHVAMASVMAKTRMASRQ